MAAVDDRGSFRAAFAESIRTKTDMLAYARLQCKNEFYVSTDYTSAPKEVLFEIRGRPHYLPSSDDFKCYFAMAQPYPSRNTAMYVHSPVRNVLGHEANGAACRKAEHVP